MVVNADVEQAVTLDINNLDEIAPTLTSGANSNCRIEENSGASKVIYTATADDSAMMLAMVSPSV
jgi:hypothetical protein